MIKFFFDEASREADKYEMHVKEGDNWDIYSFSENAMSPLGVNTFLGTYATRAGGGEGKPIDFDALPDEVRRAMIARLTF